MKFSEKTITILKNFAGINNSILVKSGQKLKTISVARNILAEADISEEFSKDFAIYDLNQFLNGLNLHNDPEIDFTEDSYLIIREGKRKVKYFYADPNVIISPPDKEIDLPSIDREEDAGALAAHKAYWGYPENTRTNATISELVFVPDALVDGYYLLDLQTASFELDVSPGKPVLYGIKEV